MFYNSVFFFFFYKYKMKKSWPNSWPKPVEICSLHLRSHLLPSLLSCFCPYLTSLCLSHTISIFKFPFIQNSFASSHSWEELSPPTILIQSSSHPPGSSSLMLLHISSPAQFLFITFPTSGSPPPPPLLCAAGGALPLVLTCSGTDSVKVLTPHSGLCQGLVLRTHTSACRVHA